MNKKYVGYRPTWAEINLGSLRYNFLLIKKILAEKKIMVCVKADAYGHGLIPVSRTLASCGTDYLGVASIDEGIILRKNGITLPILVLGAALKSDLEPVFSYNLIPTVCSEEIAVVLNRIAESKGKPVNVHIKVDTGMGRIGFLYHQALSSIRRIHSLKFIKIEGIFTHLACADVNRAFTLQQIKLFNTLISGLKDSGIEIKLAHAANSMGIVGFKDSHFNMARPGLICYGLYPRLKLGIKLKPVLSLKTKIVFAKRVPRGYGISYGHIYKTRQNTTVVTLPIGYGDGYPRNLSNLGPLLIKGKRFTLSGRVCMDQIMVDVGNSKVKIGDEVILIGTQGKDLITTEELARLANTIPYEIVCGLGSRIPRVYTK